MKKSTFLLFGFALAASFPAVAAVPDRPNFIVIVSDGLAWGDLGCYGSREVVSPNLDRLAAEGVRATSFYTTSAECTPARASLLTGRYPQRHGITTSIYNDRDSDRHRYTPVEYSYSEEAILGLDRREVVLGQLLKDAGYATGVVGKWDLGRAFRFRPLQRGFDFFYGILNTATDYWTGERYGIPSTFRGNAPEIPHGYADDLFTREALAFVGQNRDRPFFLYLAYHAPSGNSSLATRSRRVPKPYLDLYPNRGGPIPEITQRLSPRDERTEYMAAVSGMDAGIGQLMALLHSSGLDRKTLVLFLSDKGWNPPAADPGPYRNTGSREYNRLGEGGVRTDFIARWPGVLPAGTASAEFISILDIFPTLASAANVPPPAGLKLDGFDLLPVLQGKRPSPRNEMFWQSREGDRAARVGAYKWAQTSFYHGLFDVDHDLAEARDLSAEQPDLLRQIKSRWEAWRRQMDAAEPRGPYQN